MKYVYSDLYLEDAMINLADAFDYAVNGCGLDIEYFMDLFIKSGYAKNFSIANPTVVSGMSGIELVLHILDKMNIDNNTPDFNGNLELSEEYWVGWILAYYQWESGCSFDEIHEYLSMKTLRKLYHSLHEVSEKRAAMSINKIINRNKGNQ